MNAETRNALVRAAEIAKFALPLIAPGAPFVGIAVGLVNTGLTWADARAALAANNATPEQLAYLDSQNEVDVFEAIREQGGAI